MSTSTASSDASQSITTPLSEKLERLTIEAGKFLGKSPGDTLPTSEVRRQAEANGYREGEIDALLPESDALTVPEQGDTFGELWAIDSRAPNPTDPLPRFRDWLSGKREKRHREYDNGEYQHPVEHAYSYKSEIQKFARAKDVGRHFVREYDEFTTVLITYFTPLESDETVADHAQRYYPRSIVRKRRRILKSVDVWNECAGVSLLAPKEPADDVAPNPRPPTHAHDALWIPGHISPDTFDSLESTDGFDIDVSVRHHDSDDVQTPTAVNRQDLEQERGATTALAQEVGANLPVLTAIDTYRKEMGNLVRFPGGA